METIIEWREKLSSSRKAIVVEGIKDKAALARLGVDNRIYFLNKKPIFSVVEEISENEKDIVILTDFDKQGKVLYGRLNSELQRFGVRIDNVFREWLQNHTRLSHIEGLDASTSVRS